VAFGRQLAVLARGGLVFRGTVDDLTNRATGQVWTLATTEVEPAGGVLVSALPLTEGFRYRLVAWTPPAGARPATPTLEDGYLALSWQEQKSN
jgi:hypothetical protein